MIAVSSWLIANKKGVTYLAFGILFVARVISGYLSARDGNNIAPLFIEFYFIVSLIMLSIFILANKDTLDKFNVDKYSVYAFVLSGITLFLSFGLSLRGIAAILCSFLVAGVLYKSKIEPDRKGSFFFIIWFIAIGIIPELLFKLFFSDYYQGYKFFSGLSIGTIFSINSITSWNVLSEEFLFRSILWGILNDWKFSDNKIVLTQAFLFWLVHLDLIANNFFGLSILIFGVWVGFLTLRSKSLTPSIATHFFHNITSRLP